MRRAVFSLVLLSLIAAAPATQPVDTRVQALINQLGDMQSSVREKATNDLASRGGWARAALVEASKSDDPEISARASMILRSLPWDRPGDPPEVRALLNRYRTQGVPQRTEIVGQLLNLPDNQGLDAALRILKDETQQPVRWQIVRALRFSWTKVTPPFTSAQAAARREAAQAFDTTADDAPILALAASAWKDEKEDLAATLYLRAALSADFPTDFNEDGGEIGEAYRTAIFLLWPKRKFDDVARLMRHKAENAQGDMVAGVPEGVCELFALHAKVGPVAGYAVDCHQYREMLLRPPLLYAFSYQLMRGKHDLLSSLLDRIACFSGGGDATQHLQVAEFLQYNFWHRAAIREYYTYLAMQPADESIEHKTQIANVHLSLGMMLGQVYSHLQAAKEIETGLAILDTVPAVLTRNRDGRSMTGDDAKREMQAEMNGHFLQDALARDDQAEIAKRMKLLVDLQPEDSEIVQEMVAYYTRQGDNATADKLFTPAERRLRDQLKTERGGQPLNSLAWYLARSGRKLDEALKLATEAVTNDPDNAAFIDTLAEVNFQLGHLDEAIKLETKALTIEPGRPELESQMKRFKRGNSRSNAR